MRRILGLTLLLLAITVPLALAAGTPTDGTLSVKRGKGTLALKVTGTIIGHVNNGRIQIRDFRPNDANAPQWSCKRRRISKQVSYCTGRNLGFRVEDGRFTVNVRGNRDLDLGRGARGSGHRRHGRQRPERRRDVDRQRALPVAAGLLDGLHPRVAAARELTPSLS